MFFSRGGIIRRDLSRIFVSSQGSLYVRTVDPPVYPRVPPRRYAHARAADDRIIAVRGAATDGAPSHAGRDKPALRLIGGTAGAPPPPQKSRGSA